MRRPSPGYGRWHRVNFRLRFQPVECSYCTLDATLRIGRFRLLCHEPRPCPSLSLILTLGTSTGNIIAPSLVQYRGDSMGKREAAKVLVRLQPAQKEWLVAEAARNGSSINSEIVRAVHERIQRVQAGKRREQARALASEVAA